MMDIGAAIAFLMGVVLLFGIAIGGALFWLLPYLFHHIHVSWA
jgi:hypothetical protein